MKDKTIPREDVESVAEKTEKMDRRGFFSTVGKAIIPTLGILGLSLTAFSTKANAACADTCTGGCSNSCKGCFSCTGGCSGTCDRTCVGICADSCTVTSR
jgi:CXXX repeat radical SAM target protein